MSDGVACVTPGARDDGSELARALFLAMERQRAQLARALHDETAQSLASLLLRFGLAEMSGSVDEFRVRLGELRELTSKVAEDVRRLVNDLQPAALLDLGLVPALRGFVTRAASESGLTIDFRSIGDDLRMPAELEMHLFRIAREAVSNAIRHAAASTITVLVARPGVTVQLLVEDDGRGFDPTTVSSGGGLSEIRLRARLAGGVCSIEAEPGKGAAVLIRVPLEPT